MHYINVSQWQVKNTAAIWHKLHRVSFWVYAKNDGAWPGETASLMEKMHDPGHTYVLALLPTNANVFGSSFNCCENIKLYPELKIPTGTEVHMTSCQTDSKVYKRSVLKCKEQGTAAVNTSLVSTGKTVCRLLQQVHPWWCLELTERQDYGW